MKKASFHRSFLSLAGLAAGVILLAGGEAGAAIVVPVSGSVTDASGTVALSGTATVETTLVQDEFGGAPSVLVSIHLDNVTGHGAGTGALFQGSAAEAVLVRPLSASDTVEVGVVLGAPGNSGAAGRAATAMLALSLDPASGAVLSAAGSFAP